MRALPVAATVFFGLTFGAAAQMLGPGMGFPGAGAGMPGFNTAPAAPPPQQRQRAAVLPRVRADEGRSRKARPGADRPR